MNRIYICVLACRGIEKKSLSNKTINSVWNWRQEEAHFDSYLNFNNESIFIY